MSDSEDLVELPEDEGDDLFGDEEEEQQQQVNSEQGDEQSDQDLASDRDADDADERDGDVSDHKEMRDKIIELVDMYRHRIPKSQDGSLTSLRVPKFLKLVPELYDPATFRPSESDIANAKEETPQATIRFRRDNKTGKAQSNAAIHRWSDGTMTMTVGDEHYEIHKKALAPPMDKPYQELQDAHYYAASAQLASNTLMIVGHVSEQFTVWPGKAIQDDALARLKARMEIVAKTKDEEDMIIKTTKDPELQKREAEQAEKERMKAQRRRETAAARMDVGQGRYGRGGGLSIGDLEGGRRAGGARKRGPPGAQKQKRRKPEYDSDDDLPSGARRGDDYDIEDDFIAPSDEDVESGVEDDEEEILDDDDDDDDDQPRSKRQKTADAEDADADAEGDMDDDLPPHEASSRNRRRNIIDDDDE